MNGTLFPHQEIRKSIHFYAIIQSERIIGKEGVTVGGYFIAQGNMEQVPGPYWIGVFREGKGPVTRRHQTARLGDAEIGVQGQLPGEPGILRGLVNIPDPAGGLYPVPLAYNG